MKQLLTSAFAFMLLVLLTQPLRAQTDSVARSQVAAPVFDSAAIAVPEEGMEDYYAPEGMRRGRRNPIYYFGHDFSTVFVELSLLAGNDDQGLGITAAYVPEVWGGYATWQAGRQSQWVAAGATYRLSSPWNKTDWHLFGGVAAGHGIGGEVGLRIAANSFTNMGKLAYFSGSAAIRATNHGVYFVGGLSVALSAIGFVAWAVL